MQIKPNTFICADSIEVLREIPDKAFTLCLTDPPYGVRGGDMSGVLTAETKGKYKLFENVAPESFDDIFRVSQNQIIWGGNYFRLPVSRGWIYWNKQTPTHVFADGELAWTSFDRNLRMVDYMWTNVKCGWGAKTKYNKPANLHPTQKPVPVFEWCLINYSKPGDLVIDPFCGSGTTALACHKTGRKFLCIDKDEEYIKIAQQRYADLIAQQDLFGQNQDGAQNNSEGRGTACNSGRDAMPLDIFEGVQ